MAKQIKETFQVQGMVCTGCAELVENALKELDGVSWAHADFSKNQVTVLYDAQRTDFKAMSAAVSAAGYSIQKTAGITTAEQEQQKKGEEETQKFSGKQFAGIIILILAVFLIVKDTVGFQFIPEITSSMGYGVLFLVGLLTSIHCVAMCGGINMSQCINGKTETEGWKGTIRPSFLYNLGRVISYTLIGGIIGAAGSVITPGGKARGLIAVLSGVFMVIMGLGMTGIFPWLNRITPRMPKSLRRMAGRAGRGKGPLAVGLINGLMPCGPLQAMQIYALGTGSALAGALSMLFFSLGTLPLMFGLGALLTVLGHRFTQRMMKVSAALVVALGIVMLGRGLALSGITLFPSAAVSLAAGNSAAAASEISPVSAEEISPTAASAGTSPASAAESDGSAQNITSELGDYGYPNITVQKGKAVVWNLHAAAGKVNGCNRVLVIPDYNVQAELKTGDNIIRFTPSSSGTITYSCWMGMQTGQIHVVDQTTLKQENAAGQNETAATETAATETAASSETAGPAQGIAAGGSCCKKGAAASGSGMACCNGAAVQ